MKTDLSQYVTASDSALLEKQLEQLHSQWEELCMKVRTDRKVNSERGGLCVLGTADETGKREKERLGREGGKSCYQLCFGGDQQHKALHHTQRHAHKHTQTLTLICVRKEPACAGSWRENCICLLFSNLPPCKPNDLFVNISSAVW